MKLTPTEKKFSEFTKKWTNLGKELFIVFFLGAAAVLMVFGWIYHLKIAENIKLGYWEAFGISIAFIIIEYLINTWITRYSKTENLFSPGQLAIISIVTGLFTTAILSVTMFQYTYTLKNKITNGFGFGFVMIGAVLLLYDKEFSYKKIIFK